jgi:hypothetical protein
MSAVSALLTGKPVLVGGAAKLQLVGLFVELVLLINWACVCTQ